MKTGIREIILDYFKNDQSPKVRARFAAWMKDSAGRDEKEAALAEVWNRLDVPADESTERSYDRLYAAIRSVKRMTLARRFSRAAAILALPLLSVGITWWIMRDSAAAENRLELVECFVPYGEIRTVTLPDSSVVKVNSGSILIYPKEFTADREVFLNGEAYFSVTKDETRSFFVKTSDMDVAVLGTVFDISAYADSENRTATLESGRVDVSFKNRAAAPVSLAPGEQVNLDVKSGTIETRRANIENTIAWTCGNMVIQNMSVNEVAKCIERRYNMKVYLNSTDYVGDRISMKVHSDETIVDFMEVLKVIVPNLKYKIKGDHLFIY